MKHPAISLIARLVLSACCANHVVAQLLPVGQIVEPTKVRVNGVELHYIERGNGQPVILLHGGQSDYRSWRPQIEALSSHYRVIAYSRRYNYPNDNPPTATYRSAYTDAEDLAALIRHLKLESVDLVGTSAGALAALVLAIQHPEMVHSMVLAEPPVHRWAKDDPAGAALYAEFMTSIWEPAGDAFRAGDDVGAMRIFVDGFGGKGRFDALPAESRAVALENARFFKVSTASSDPFPEIPADKVKELTMPVLIITGENTVRLHRFVNDELARLLPTATRVTIPRAGHGSARENPAAFNEVVINFLVISVASVNLAAGIPEELEQAVRARDQAVEKRDASTWDRMTMPGFFVVRPEGRLMNKAERLAQIKAEKAEPRPKPKQEQFIRYGDTVIRQLQEANGTFWIDVWVKDDDSWRVASSQGTRPESKR